LVDQDREIAVRVDPFGIHRTDDRLRSRPDDEGLFELSEEQAFHLYPSLSDEWVTTAQFFGKTFHMGSFFFRKT